MKLRAIEIVGFKSFRDRVCLEIGDGMTCIVGPNGCGKSNVVDALKWAMGDMSPKSLRGDSMQDVIFAGTETRKPGGLAQVTLKFENTDVPAPEGDVSTPEGEVALDVELEDKLDEDEPPESDGQADWAMGKSIPREFRHLTEIAITRRLHRSGESEYLINKVPCRLRDIRDLLAGTGLGKQGYSIIEQGQIGFIVNARPEDRRLIIEEASGITRYKDQRQRAERKLDRTEQNLQRTRDILDEIEKQMGTLERQAKKAKEFQELSRELESLELALLLARRSDAARRASKKKGELKEAQKEAEVATEKLEKSDEQLKSARVNAHQADRRHVDLTENYYRVETRLNLARSNREHAAQARIAAQERREQLLRDQSQQEERRIQMTAELIEVQQTLADLESNPEEKGRALQDFEKKLALLKGERRDVNSDREALRAQVEEHRGLARQLENRLQWIEEQLEDFARRSTEVTNSVEDVGEEREELQRRISRLTMDYERVQDEIEANSARSTRASEVLEAARSTLSEAAEEESSLARRKLDLTTRIESIEAMRRRGEGYDKGVRRVLEWAREAGRSDILGPAGDFLQVPEGTEAAVAAFIGERLGDIVVRSRESALDALNLLGDEEAGRVGCFPVAEDEGELAAVISRWLDDLEIVDDLAQVPDFSANEIRGTAKAWATPAGDIIFADGRVVGGSVGERTETLLRQARQLEELKAELEGVAADFEAAREKLELSQVELSDANEELRASREALQEATHRARGIDQERETELREQERARQRLERIAGEQKKISDGRLSLIEERAGRQGRLREVMAALPELEEKLKALTEELTRRDEELEHLGARLTDHKVEVAQIHERRRHLRETAARLEGGIASGAERLKKIALDIEDQAARADEARMKAEALAGEVLSLEKDHKAMDEEVRNSRETLQSAANRVETMELTVLARRQDRDEAQLRVQKVEMALREASIAMENVDEQLQERFSLELEQAQQLARDVQTPPEERKKRAKDLRRRIQNIGPVNPLAIEEFEETKERHQFHAEQQMDLEQSVADLRDAIARMDGESRKRFGETFRAVNEKFRTVFPRLFRGGMAQLILTDPTDMLNTGVDIEVRPPGKKLQNVTLLSGGEKALTAVSLIFSIFLLKPTPFAVLDEVDAPLDEANVGRFAEMVRNLSETSQMIVITHNRRTMEAPERLYGVTMQEAGVSKLVSVKLSDIDDRLAS